MAIVTACLALLEESDWAWRNLLNRATLTWASTVTSALALVAAAAQSQSKFFEARFCLSAAAVLLPIVWARATRRAELLALGVAFSAAVGPWWCAPVFALVAGRLLELTRCASSSASRGCRTLQRSRDVSWKRSRSLVSSAVAALSVTVDAIHGLAWCPALLLMGGGLPALRLAVAVAVAVPFEPMRAPMVGVLVALGAAARHAPAHLKRMLGVRSLEYFEPVAFVLSIAGAAGMTLVAPPSAPVLTSQCWPSPRSVRFIAVRMTEASFAAPSPCWRALRWAARWPPSIRSGCSP